MAGLNIHAATKALIDAQPERKPPLELSRDRTGAIMIAEAAAARADEIECCRIFPSTRTARKARK